MGQMTLAVKSADNPGRTMAAVEREVRAMGSDILVTEMMTLGQQVDAALVQERLLAAVGGFFSVLALVLSAVGLYGLLAHVVGQRTGEIGIHMALGADRAAVVWMIRDAVCGWWRSAWQSECRRRYWRRLPGGTSSGSPTDAAISRWCWSPAPCCLPARRASRIDPITALRAE